MKKFLFACGLICAISAATAQPAPTTAADHPMPTHRMMMHEQAFDPAERAAHLQKTLQLSDEQTAKVKKVFEDNAQQRKALEDKYKPQLEAFHADMKKLHEQAHTQLNGILTPKQQQAFEAQHKTHGGMYSHANGGKEHEHGESAPAK